MRKKMLKSTFKLFNGLMDNIETNTQNLIGLSYILENPRIINVEELKHENIRVAETCEFTVPIRQALGLDLLPHQRTNRAQEVKANAKRVLIADTAELVVDNILRAHTIFQTGKDPYYDEHLFSVKFNYLYTGSKSPSQFLNSDEKKFIRDLLEPLRNYIRHNNSFIVPSKKVVFNRTMCGIDFKISLSKKIHLNYQQCQNIFNVSRIVTNNYFIKLLEECADV